MVHACRHGSWRMSSFSASMPARAGERKHGERWLHAEGAGFREERIRETNLRTSTNKLAARRQARPATPPQTGAPWRRERLRVRVLFAMVCLPTRGCAPARARARRADCSSRGKRVDSSDSSLRPRSSGTPLRSSGKGHWQGRQGASAPATPMAAATLPPGRRWGRAHESARSRRCYLKVSLWGRSVWPIGCCLGRSSRQLNQSGSNE